MFRSVHTPTGDREGKRPKERSGRRRRKSESKKDPSPTHTGWRQRKIEEERTRRNTWYFGRISLCMRPERDTESGFRPDMAGNLDDFARSGRKPRRPRQIRPKTHAHRRGFDKFGTPSLALSPVVPIPPFRRDLVARVNQRTQKGKTRSFRLKCRRIAFCFTLKVVVRPAGVHEELGFTFAMWGSEGLRLLGEYASFWHASQSASFSLDAFEPLIVFRSTAEKLGAYMCLLNTYEFQNRLKIYISRRFFSNRP
jgi:hypothetical protein